MLPGNFPKPDKCMLLQNNKEFYKRNRSVRKELINPGIVNQAVWADTDGDGKKNYR